MEGDRICLNAGELVVIYVYVNERGGVSGWIAKGEAGAYPDYHVGVPHDIKELVHLLPLPAGAEAGAVAEGMSVRHRALASVGLDDGYVGCFRKAHEGVLGICTGDSTAGVDDRALGFSYNACGHTQQGGAGNDGRYGGRLQ